MGWNKLFFYCIIINTVNRRLAIVAFLFALLGGCKAVEEVTEYQVRAAQSSLRVSFALLRETEAAEPAVPSPLSAIKSGALLSREETDLRFPPALPGVPEPGAEGVIHDAALLERLIELLRQDVRELLNASPDRAETLDEYTEALSSHLQRGEVRLRALRDREESLRDDEDRLKRVIDELRENLDGAIRGGEGGNVAALMEDLTERHEAFAEVQTELIVVQRSLEALDRVLPTLKERLHAIQANREALIKGVRVIDLPGVEDLGLIVVEDGRARIRRR